MNEESNNIFGRHRNLIFGFAVVILILNIALFVLVPQQTPVEINETVTEYAADDENFAVEHTVQLTGTLTKSMIAKNTFEGTIWMSDVDGLDAPLGVHLTREDGRWHARRAIWPRSTPGRTLTILSSPSGTRASRRRTAGSLRAMTPVLRTSRRWAQLTAESR